MKICSKCNIKQKLVNFSIRNRSKDGYKSWCKTCDKVHHAINRNSIINNKKLHYQENKEQHKIRTEIWRKTNPENLKENDAKYYQENKETIYNKDKNWRKNNPDKRNAISAKRRAAKLNATLKLPKDQNILISEFYKESHRLSKETGIAYQVDHIIPLQGKTVSGLHVPWNLRVITRKENIKKGNRITIGPA
jgi:thiol-disulfide isomerase/thioredoxin